MGISPARPFTTTRIKLSAAGSSDDTTARKDLAYSWDFNNDGESDATGPEVTKRFRNAGYRKIALTVTNEAGNATSVGRTVLVRRLIRCHADRVTKTGSWTNVRNRRANGGSYCRNDSDPTTRDVLEMRFKGPRLVVIHGDSARGGRAAVLIDGRRMKTMSFRGDQRRIAFGQKLALSGLGKGPHTVKIVMQRGRGYVEGFSMRS